MLAIVLRAGATVAVEAEDEWLDPAASLLFIRRVARGEWHGDRWCLPLFVSNSRAVSALFSAIGTSWIAQFVLRRRAANRLCQRELSHKMAKRGQELAAAERE